MQKKVFYLIVLFTILLAGCSEAKEFKASNGQEINNNEISEGLAKDFNVYGITIGDTLEKVVDKMGVPSDKWEASGAWVYKYSDELKIAIFDERVVGIFSNDSEFKTSHGIGVGSSIKDINGVYSGYRLGMMESYLKHGYSPILVEDDNNYLLFDGSNTVNSIAIVTKENANSILNSDFSIDKFIYKELTIELIDSLRDTNLVKVKELISRGLDVNMILQGDPLLTYVTLNYPGQTELINILVENGANDSAVFGKISDKNIIDKELYAILLKSGANINAIDGDGTTALMYACAYGEEEVVDLLLQHGADIHIVDNMGRTAYWYASMNGYESILNKLSNAGAENEEYDSYNQPTVEVHIKVNLVEEDGRRKIVPVDTDLYEIPSNSLVKFIPEGTELISLFENEEINLFSDWGNSTPLNYTESQRISSWYNSIPYQLVITEDYGKLITFSISLMENPEDDTLITVYVR